MNLVDAEAYGERASAMSGRLELQLAPAVRSKAYGPITLGIRSEDIRIGPNEAVEGKVHDVENHGVEKIVTLKVDDHLFKATVPATSDVRMEANVRFSWDSGKLHCFDRGTGVNLAS
jgi:multiple sugar transport system ATP-binding protein